VAPVAPVAPVGPVGPGAPTLLDQSISSSSFSQANGESFWFTAVFLFQ
jgi:hypothetical protein